MDVIKMLAELSQEHQQIEAIMTLERLARGRGRRRGRPPAWMTTRQPTTPQPTAKNKRKVRPEVRQRMAKLSGAGGPKHESHRVPERDNVFSAEVPGP
jgi:hypothetical protein